MQAFSRFIRLSEPSARSLIADPSPTNHRAIRAFGKAGFTIDREIATPDGPALLMRMAI